MGVDEIVDMVHEQIEAGLIRYAGVSNWRGSRIQEANTYARKAKRHPFVISQVQGSLAEMTHPHARPKSDMVYLEPTELQWHYRTGFPLMCYSSTAGGLFATGKIKGTSFDNPITEARHLRAQQLARQLKATTNQIALAYLLSQPHLTFPITGTLKVDHLREAIAAADIKLTPAQIQWLRDGD
jgi:aryl-alcohol dehydrogenase-like predicted oxidoreductase